MLPFFSMNRDTATLVISFFLYSFAGWAAETAYAGVMEHRFVNRGFLYGPFCPIYGFGVLSIVLLSSLVGSHYLLVFLICVAGCSALEYLTGYVLEVFFHSKCWDYSKQPFNLRGRICLSFSVLWGILGFLLVVFVNPFLLGTIGGFTATRAGKITAYMLLAYIVIDASATLNKLIRFREVLRQLEDVTLEIREKLISMLITAPEKTLLLEKLPETIRKRYGRLENIPLELLERTHDVPKDLLSKISSLDSFLETVSNTRLGAVSSELKERFDQAVSRALSKHSRFFLAFPNFSSTRIRSALEEIRHKIERKP